MLYEISCYDDEGNRCGNAKTICGNR